MAQGVLIAPLGIFSGPTTMTPAIITPLLKMAGLTLLLCCFAIAQQRANTGALSLTSIIQAMENSQSDVRRQVPYQVIREYSLSGMKTTSANADVVAQVDFNPPTGKDYSIQKWSAAREGSRSCSVSSIMKWKRAKAIKVEPRLRGTTTISSK